MRVQLKEKVNLEKFFLKFFFYFLIIFSFVGCNFFVLLGTSVNSAVNPLTEDPSPVGDSNTNPNLPKTLTNISYLDFNLRTSPFYSNEVLGPFTPEVGTSDGGTVDASYAIEPALSGGLSLDTATGEISGTPTELIDQTYRVTATGKGDYLGSSVFTEISIQVLAQQLTSIAYASRTNVFDLNEAISITPVIEFTGASTPTNTFRIEPALSGGLSLDTATGVISGTPTELIDQTTYRVTATGTGNYAGSSVSTEVFLSVVASNRLTAMSYDLGSDPFYLNEVLGSFTPVVTTSDREAANASYGIEPALSGGLNFDTATGEISGTPTELIDETYRVTATGKGDYLGSSVFTEISIQVLAQQLTSIAYASRTNVFDLNGAISITPVIEFSGASTPTNTFRIEPALSGGLSLDTATGEISGTPTELIDQTTYRVTATGTGNYAGSSVTTEVFLSVVDSTRLTAMSYPDFNLGTTPFYSNEVLGPFTPEVGTSDREAANASYGIEPALSGGLNFDTATGEISGTPTELIDETYRVTATGKGDYLGSSVTNEISIQVLAQELTSIAYSRTNVFDLNQSVSITPVIEFTGASTPVNTFTIEPSSLIEGLSFDTTTGVISGRPSKLGNQTYTVKATGQGNYASSSVSTEVTVNVGMSMLFAANGANQTVRFNNTSSAYAPDINVINTSSSSSQILFRYFYPSSTGDLLLRDSQFLSVFQNKTNISDLTNDSFAASEGSSEFPGGFIANTRPTTAAGTLNSVYYSGVDYVIYEGSYSSSGTRITSVVGDSLFLDSSSLAPDLIGGGDPTIDSSTVSIFYDPESFTSGSYTIRFTLTPDRNGAIVNGEPTAAGKGSINVFNIFKGQFAEGTNNPGPILFTQRWSDVEARTSKDYEFTFDLADDEGINLLLNSGFGYTIAIKDIYIEKN